MRAERALIGVGRLWESREMNSLYVLSTCLKEDN